MAQEKKAVMKKAVMLAAAAAVMLAGYLIIKFAYVPQDDGGDILHDHGGYVTYIEVSMINSAELVPASGEAFTITAKDGGFYLDEGCNAEELYMTVACAASLTYLEELGPPAAPLSDYGLDPPAMTVTLKTGNGETVFYVGGTSLNEYAVYVLANGILYLCDSEITDQITLPKNAYRIRELWPGDPGDRPTLTEITTRNFTVVRRDLDEDAPIGLSRYELTSPVSFLCNDASVSDLVMNGLLAIDLDEIAVDVDFELAGEVRIKADGFDRTLYVGGETPEGWRYLMLDGDDTVYIDKLGGYGFLDVTPLDLTYGLAFWLYSFDDVKEIAVTDGGVVRKMPDGTSEVNRRRFFARVINFSVVENALTEEIDTDNRVTLYMNDGSVHELCLTRQNERQLAVSVDGATPVFACNIKDWQVILEDLDLLDAGKNISEG